MKTTLLLRCWLGLALLLAGPGLTRAQTAGPDIILRTDGSELPGRVLSITPRELRYLPPAGADTLRLAAADVFLVRYANGTRELLHPVAPAPATPPDLLPGLDAPQRQALGRQDAARNYTQRGAFWGSLGATLYAGPLLGLVAPAVIAPHRVATPNLHAPRPELLADPAYDEAYRQEAQRRKRGRAWGGYGTGVGMWVLLIGTLVASLP